MSGPCYWNGCSVPRHRSGRREPVDDTSLRPHGRSYERNELALESHQASALDEFCNVAFEVFGGFQPFASGFLAFFVADGIRFLDLGFRFHGKEDRSSPRKRVSALAKTEYE